MFVHACICTYVYNVHNFVSAKLFMYMYVHSL